MIKYDDFYVTLPSNSSMKYFPENKLTNYKVKLAKPLEFREPFEVALVEMSFTRPWLDIDDDNDRRLTITDLGNNTKMDINLNKRSFTSPKDLVQSINRAITERLDPGKLSQEINDLNGKLNNKTIIITNSDTTYDHSESVAANIRAAKDIEDITLSKLNIEYADLQAHKTYLEGLQVFKLKPSAGAWFNYKKDLIEVSMPPNARFKLSDVLQHALHLKSDTLVNKTTDKKIINIPTIDFSTDITKIFVYINCIDYQFVGDSFVPLLREVAINEKDGHFITKTFDSPFYRRVNRSHIQEIEIDIRDVYGNPIPFTSGDIVVITLHFRHRSDIL